MRKLTVPKRRYKEDLNKILEVYKEVESTHKGLGKLAVFELLCDSANKCLLVIGSAGTGKSAVAKSVYNNIKRDKVYYDAITIVGLKKIQDFLTENRVSILVDDLSKGYTEYSQLSTVVIFSELCYTGWFRKTTAQYDLNIYGFKGSCIINLQPLLLKRIVSDPTFETDIRDKAIRYYHMVFPIKENLDRPKIDINYDYVEYENVLIDHSIIHNKMYKDAYENFRYEFTKSRAKEHLNDLIKASALLNDRRKVTSGDLWLVRELSKNFRIEHEIFTKDELEGSRFINPNVLPLLSALNTYGKVSIRELCLRFQLKKRRIYQIINDLTEYCLIVKNHSYIVPTEYTKELLREIGEKA